MSRAPKRLGVGDDPPHPGQPLAQRLLQPVDCCMHEFDAAAAIDLAVKGDKNAVIIDPDPDIVDLGQRPVGGDIAEKPLDFGQPIGRGVLAGEDPRLQRLDMGLDLDLAAELAARSCSSAVAISWAAANGIALDLEVERDRKAIVECCAVK